MPTPRLFLLAVALAALLVFALAALLWFAPRPARAQSAASGPAPAPGKCPASAACFFAVGDTGAGNADQLAVAQAIQAKCAADGCQFGVLLGDLIYRSSAGPDGPTDGKDPRLEGLLGRYYGKAALGIPILLVMGNHDYGNHEAWEKAAYYAEYTRNPDQRFRMPGGQTYYPYGQGPVLLLALDLERVQAGKAMDEQGAMIDRSLAGSPPNGSRSSGVWRIAAAHRPYLSNGHHGNATGNVQRFVRERVCGHGVQVFLAGHDHDLQILLPSAACPGVAVHVVAGGGGQYLDRTDPSKGPDAAEWQRHGIFGFAYVQATRTRLRIQMIGKDGVCLHSYTLTNPAQPQGVGSATCTALTGS